MCVAFKHLSAGQRLQILGVYLNGSMLVDQSDCQNESQGASLPYQGAANAFHGTPLDANSFANNKFAVRLELLITHAGAQKFDLSIGKGNMLSAITHNVQHAGGLENPGPLSWIYVDKQVAGKERQDKLFSLSVFPDSDGLVRRKKRLDVA